MARKTLRMIAGLLAVARVSTPGLEPVLKLVADPKDKALKFSGVVSIDGTDYTVAADNGKNKTYGTADQFVKDAAKYLETNTGTYTVSVETGVLLVGAIPSDLKKDAASKVVKYGQTKTSQNTVLTDLNSQLALMAGWDNGNALQKAKFAEVSAQKAAVVEDVAAIDALITKYTAIANG